MSKPSNEELLISKAMNNGYKNKITTIKNIIKFLQIPIIKESLFKIILSTLI